MKKIIFAFFLVCFFSICFCSCEKYEDLNVEKKFEQQIQQKKAIAEVDNKPRAKSKASLVTH
jgi:hypothetical protein